MDRIHDYSPPSWASHLAVVPTTIAKLANTPTPIHEWKLPGTPDDFKVYIKRDDMTGSVLSGNKVRKLEFILADAIEKGCKHVITVGAETSNHTRAVAVAAREMGLTPHLFYLTQEADPSKLMEEGNAWLCRLAGADVHLIPLKNFRSFQQDSRPRMLQLAKEIQEKTGEKSMVISAGGFGALSTWGYMQCFEEIRNQGVEFDDLVCVSGTGGSYVGLAIGNYLCGSPYRVHGIAVAKEIGDMVADASMLANMELDQLGITAVRAEDICHYHDVYIGNGYFGSQPCELEFIAKTTAATGIILDKTYTGKGAYGLSKLMQDKPEVFKGRRVLFIHTGGMFGLFTTPVRDLLSPYIAKDNITVSPPV